MSSKDRFELIEMTPEMMKRLGIDPRELLDFLEGRGVSDEPTSGGILDGFLDGLPGGATRTFQKVIMDRVPVFKAFVLRAAEGILIADKQQVVSGLEGFLLVLTMVMKELDLAEEVVASYRKNALETGDRIDDTVNRLLDAIRDIDDQPCTCPRCEARRAESTDPLGGSITANIEDIDLEDIPRG